MSFSYSAFCIVSAICRGLKQWALIVVRVHPKRNEKLWGKNIMQGQEHIQSYDIRAEGREYRRNRRHLRANKEYFARELSLVPRMLDKQTSRYHRHHIS